MSNKKFKKILFIDPSPSKKHYGGSTISLLQMLKYNENPSWASEIIVLFLYPNEIHKEFSKIKNVQTFVLLKSQKYLSNFYHRIKKYLSFFLFLLKNQNFELIVVNSRIGSGRFAIIIGRLLGLRVVVHERLQSNISLLTKFFLKSVKIVAVSNHIKKNLTDQGVKSSSIQTIYNGVKVCDLIERKKRNIYKVIMVGNIVEWKGQHIFIDSYKYLKSKNVKYFIAGNIHDQKYFNSFSNKFDNNKITFLGFESQIIKNLSKYDILVHASQTPEPFGRSIIEAMSVGVPVIASDAGGPKEIITDMEDGLLFKRKSAKHLSSKIELLINDYNLTEKLIFKGYENVKNNFNIRNTSKNYLKIYRERAFIL